MSAADVCLSAGSIGGVSEAAFRPGWMRPLAFGLVLAMHAALLIVVRGDPAPITPLDAIAVTLEPLGDAPEDQRKLDEVQPVEAPPPPAPPVEEAQLTAPPPEVEAPQAIPLPVEQPKPIAPTKPVVTEKNDLPTPAELRQQQRRKLEALEKRRKPQEARREARRGAAEGAPEAGVSRGDYAGLLLAELRCHQFYPPSARADGATGVVGVAFTVGASGRIVRQSITRSSGNDALDAAARAMMSAVSAPPPPGGSFSTSTSIRFHLN